MAHPNAKAPLGAFLGEMKVHSSHTSSPTQPGSPRDSLPLGDVAMGRLEEDGESPHVPCLKKWRKYRGLFNAGRRELVRLDHPDVGRENWRTD